MHSEDWDRLLDEALSAEPSRSAPIDLACRVQEQIRLQAAVQRERRRVLRQLLITWSAGAACIGIVAALFILGDVWARMLDLVPGGMGVTDGMLSRVWYDAPLSSVLVLFGGSGIIVGMLALLSSAVSYGAGRPRRPA